MALSAEQIDAVLAAMRTGGGVVSRTEYGGMLGTVALSERQLRAQRLEADATLKATKILSVGGTPVILHLLDYEMEHIHPAKG